MLNKIKMEFQDVYENAIYVVLANPNSSLQQGNPEFQIQMGQRNEFLNEWMNANGYQSLAIITACNPKGLKVDGAENKKAMDRLKEQLEEMKLPYLAAYGRNREGTWREESYCIMNINMEQALGLAKSHLQNAFVWLKPNSEPELIWPDPCQNHH
jgi:hypothetical protein